MKKPLTVGISARHVHVTQQDLETLFGPGAQLTVFKNLSQPGQFASNEKVTLAGKKGKFENVRILGPVRKQTQVEISKTDSFALGIEAPVLQSGTLAEAAPITIIGPAGSIELGHAVIIAARHIHMSPEDAEAYGVRDGQIVKVRTSGPRALVFENVLVRVHPEFALDLHIDTDEANAAGVKNGDPVEVIL